MKERIYNEKILANLRQMFANSLCNQKISQNASNRLRAYSTKLFWISVLFLSLYLLINFGKSYEFHALMQNVSRDELILLFKMFKDLLGVVGVVLVIIRHWGQFEPKSIKYENTAKHYRSVRDSILSLISDYMSGSISESEVIQKRDSLKEEITAIDKCALSTKSCDYNKAQKDLRGSTYEGEHFTFSNEEINRYLPEELRITQQIQKENDILHTY